MTLGEVPLRASSGFDIIANTSVNHVLSYNKIEKILPLGGQPPGDEYEVRVLLIRGKTGVKILLPFVTWRILASTSSAPGIFMVLNMQRIT